MKFAEFETRAVLDPKTGEVQLYDMFINGVWHGSQRTLRLCKFYFDGYLAGVAK